MLLNKRQVAVRQLDTSIRMLFDGGDFVSVHTLASASATIFRDLLAAKGKATWRKEIVDSYPGGAAEADRLLKEAQNFFKHADRDPEKEIEFDEITNDETIIVATLEYGLLINGEGVKMSYPASVFQMWFFAKDPRVLEAVNDPNVNNVLESARGIFPGLMNLPRFQQLALGSEALRHPRARLGGPRK